MSGRSGLFGARPTVMLVDDRPRGIDLAALQARQLPALQDDPEPEIEDPPEEEEEEEEEYDGGGPLRIFIGSPAARGERPSMPTPTGPIWDASALASADDEDSGVREFSGSRPRPVLRRGPTAEPPPLAMSFGGSFSRGSMDAGVMDEEGVRADAQRSDSVVVHQQIYDRLLRFDEPGLPAGGLSNDPEGLDEPLSVGASEEDDASDPLGPSTPILQAGPPPERGLSVRIRPVEAPDASATPPPTSGGEEEVDMEPPRAWGPPVPKAKEPDPGKDPDDDITDATDSMTQPLEPAAVPRKVFGDGPTSTPPSRLATPPASAPVPDWSAQRRAGEPPRADNVGGEGGPGLGLAIFIGLALGLLALTLLLLQSEKAPSEPPAAPEPALRPEPAPIQPVIEPPAAEEEPPPTDEPASVGEPAPATEEPAPRLADDQGLLIVRATRPSRVFIDGRFVGHTPLPAQVLEGGTHEVRVVSIESGRTREQTVRIDPGQTRDLRFSF